jgi:peptidoglycan/xylan/chitin deacetylase (PgdA/CDA1 family)
MITNKAVTSVFAAIALLVLPSAAAAAADPSPTVVSITFDDGYSATSVGLDAMKERGMKGTLYINSQRVGYSANFFSRSQLKSYYNSGFEIGAHTLDHEDLTAMSPDEARADLCADRTNLMDMGFPVTSLAYPFGAENADVQQAAKDCGFNSGRTTSDLKAPTSCANCAVAETVPPKNPYAIRTPSTVQYTHTLDQLKTLVTQAENGGGGWVPLVFHHICDDCTTNSITLANFTAFLDWLQTRPATTTVKTVHEVIGGPVQSSPGGSEPITEMDTVTIGTKTHHIDGINAARTKDTLILYTRVRGATTGTNQYGFEVAVGADGVVTKVEDLVGNMAIPTGGYVLSGHGTSRTWLKSYAKVGVLVDLTDSTQTPPPPPPTVVYPTTKVTIGSASLAVTGVNVYRSSNALVVYTPEYGASTGTNVYGFEAVVVDGKVVKVEDKIGNIAIPDNGYVLSGHGTSRTWLKTYAVVGATVTP